MTCPRCSECEGQTHHWMDNSDFGAGLLYEDDGDDQPENPDYAFVCKHCPAVGGECPDCDGEGHNDELLADIDATDDDFFADCSRCKGTGVIEGLAYTELREDNS